MGDWVGGGRVGLVVVVVGLVGNVVVGGLGGGRVFICGSGGGIGGEDCGYDGASLFRPGVGGGGIFALQG